MAKSAKPNNPPKDKSGKESIPLEIPIKFGVSTKRSGAGKHRDKRKRRSKNPSKQLEE